MTNRIRFSYFDQSAAWLRYVITRDWKLTGNKCTVDILARALFKKCNRIHMLRGFIYIGDDVMLHMLLSEI